MIKSLRKLISLAAFAFSALLPLAAIGQPAANIQVVAPLTRNTGALITLGTQGAGTVTSTDQSGFNVSRVVCFYNQTGGANTPSTTWSIQNKDSVSGTYYSLVTSAAITTTPTTTSNLSAGAGVTDSANVRAGIPIARTWRLSTTVGGAGTITGTFACSVQ